MLALDQNGLQANPGRPRRFLGIFLRHVGCLARHAARAAADSGRLRIERGCLLLDHRSIVLLVPVFSAVVAWVRATVLGVAVWAALAFFVERRLVLFAIALRNVHGPLVVIDLLSFIDHIHCDDIHRFDNVIFLWLLSRLGELTALHRRSGA